MGTIPLPLPTMDWHNAGHPQAFALGQPDPCPFCPTDHADPCSSVADAVGRSIRCKRERGHGGAHHATIEPVDGDYAYVVSWWRP